MPSNAAATEPQNDLSHADALELRAKILRNAEQMKALASGAAQAQRGLTDDEQTKWTELAGENDKLGARLEAVNHSEWKSKNFDVRLTDVLSGLSGSVAGGPQSKASRGAGWAKAVLRHATDEVGRFKALTPSGSVLVDVPAPEAVAEGRPVTSLRQLMPNVASSGIYAFLKQSLRDSNASVVAPGALKPTSIYEFERVEDRCRTIAHLSEPIPRQDLSDAPALAQFIQVEMFDGLERALEAEIVGGDGTGEHLTGLNATAGIQTVALLGDTGVDLVKTLRRALTRLESYGLTGSGWIMNPSDWEDVETIATEDGQLLLAGAGQNVPINQAARRLWGIPVVTSVSCPVGTAYLGDFMGSTRLYIREESMISWSENVFRVDALGEGQGASDFERNLVAARAEGRFGFAVLRPSGIVKVSLTA